ncbi:MAG: CopG family ribbon-helix-helix protein [Desulfurococcales archaeon]|nr:CopG family ribbon-helix-helix protein [Desulfurococcales archaeon]
MGEQGRGEEKFGVYIPADLARQLEEYMKKSGIRSKSRLVQEGLRLLLLENAWRTEGEVAGVIGVFYNHDVKGVDEALTDIQHDYLDTIVSTLHTHLTREHCMLAIVVRGSTEKIKELVNRLRSVKGVMVVRPLLVALGKTAEPHAHHSHSSTG